MIVLGVAGMGVALWAKHAGAHLSRGPVCSRCGGKTQRLRRRIHHRVLGSMLGLELERRRCFECGWKGLAVRD